MEVSAGGVSGRTPDRAGGTAVEKEHIRAVDPPPVVTQEG